MKPVEFGWIYGTSKREVERDVSALIEWTRDFGADDEEMLKRRLEVTGPGERMAVRFDSGQLCFFRKARSTKDNE